MGIKEKIRTIPDFPKKGIQFRDITTLLRDKEGLKEIGDIFYEKYKNYKIDMVCGVESRGFIIGSIIAYRLGLGFVPVRKKGKLPGKTVQYEYELEYGKDIVEIHEDALSQGDRVLLVDDLLATGGTSIAAAKLIEKLGASIVEMCFIVDLPDVGGRKRLAEENYKYFYLCEFEGD